MKKILFILVYLYTTFNFTFALNANQETKQVGENVSVITKIFSTEMLINLSFAVIAIIVTFILSKVVTSKIASFIERNDEEGSRVELSGVISRTINISILVIGFSITLGFLGVDMGIFLGGFGFGLGFTLKIFLSNFIGGIIMVTQGSYHNGDLIKMGDKIGNIVKINSLFTEVRQFDGVIFYIPNVKFLENEVENYHINDKRRIEINIGVDFDTDLVKAKKIMLHVVENFPGILKSPESSVLITNFNESSINISLRFWINSKGEYFVTKSNITETINLAFKQHGIKIPFPQLTISNRENFQIDLKK